MIIKPLMIGLSSLCLMACTSPEVITKTQLIMVKPPAITSCDRVTIKDCAPKTNGELYQCALTISKELALCADQIDTLIEWQAKVDQ